MATTLTNRSDIDRIYGTGWNPLGLSYRILSSPSNSTKAIYECNTGSVMFISPDINCEGNRLLRLSGYLYTTLVPNSIAIWRCYCCSYNNHWITTDTSGVDANIREFILGLSLIHI